MQPSKSGNGKPEARLFNVEFRRQRKIRDPLQRTAAALLGVPFLVIGIEITVDLYSEGTVRLLWSWIVSIPCLIIAAVLLLLFRQARLRSQLHRRLFW